MTAIKKTPKEEFESLMPGENFFTPIKVSFHRIKDGVVELSRSKHAHHSPEKMLEGYGVTVLINGKHDSDKSQFFRGETAKEKAEAYIKSLQ